MKITLKRLAFGIASAGLLTIYGCGGGGSSTAPSTTNVPVTVIDGPIKNAIVCLDKNNNGVCDSGEPFAKTDAAGKVILTVDAVDAGKYPVIAVVGTDAIDADTGAVPVPFTMSAPADSVGVVSPLTTLVQQTVASTGVSTADAAASVQAATGITVSLFQDFTTTAAKAAAAVSTSPNAGDVARMIVVTTQQQSTVIGSTVVGSPAADGATITQADLSKAIQKKLMELLPKLIEAMSAPAVLAATTPADKEAALLTAATTLVTSSGLTTASMATVVAINTQASSTAPVASATPSAGFSLVGLNFTDASNFFARTLSGSLAQNTPDATNKVKYVERRYRNSANSLAVWGAGGDPWRQADLHWSGSAWVNCAINFENTTGVRDAQGNSAFNHCDSAETGKTNRATFDIAGKSMATVYTQIRTAGYTNLTIANTALLGTATFPTGSSLFYQTSTPLTNAISYYPGSGNVVTQYSAAVSAGGGATTAGCTSTEFNTTNGGKSTTLEGMIGAMTGTPCVFGSGATFSYGGTIYTNPDATNEAWGNSSVGIGTIGTAPVGTGATAPGYYSGNTRLRVAFKGTGSNPVTYYSCKERFNNGSSRNCTVIGTGSYTIATMGDARVLTLNNPPLQTSSLNYTKVFVERGGLIYSGYQNKPTVSNSARLNSIGATALLGQLGLTPDDPSEPLTLTAASYAGTYSGTFSGTDSGTFSTSINASGSKTCAGTSALTGAFACTFTLTPSTSDTTTAAITLGVTGTGSVYSGTVNFYTGAVSGTWVNGSNSGAFAGSRQ